MTIYKQSKVNDEVVTVLLLSMGTQPTTLVTINPERRIKAFSRKAQPLVYHHILKTYTFVDVATGKLPKLTGPRVEVNKRG